MAPTIGKALLVVGSVNLSPSDSVVKARLERKRLDVIVVLDSASTTADADGKKVVFLSESSVSTSLGTKFRNVTIPVIASEVAVWDEMGMTGDDWMVQIGDSLSETKLDVRGGTALSASLQGQVTVASTAAKFVWGKPGSQAIVGASLVGHPDRVALFGYDSGVSLPGGISAPARRVGLFPGRDTPAVLNSSGLALVDAAIDWALQPIVRLVVGASPLSAADTAIKSRLELFGASVKVRLSSQSSPADANGVSAIVVSESSASADIDADYRDVTVPVITLEPSILDEMGMTGTTWSVHYGEKLGQTSLEVLAPAFAGGLRGTVAVTSSPQKFVWGQPSASAKTVATISGDSSRAAIFSYSKGDAMVGKVAPADRVFFFAGKDAAAAFTSQAWTLFDAAVASALTQGALLPLRFFGGCALPGAAGKYRAVFGVENFGGANVRADPGEQSFFLPGPDDRGQPRWFKPGRQTFVAEVAAGDSVEWTLGAERLQLGPASTACTTQEGALGTEAVLGGQSFLMEINVDKATASTLVETPQLPTPGTLEGSFNVTHDGAATYTVPFWSPPGRLGIQPSIAASYSSANSSDRGHLGVGWSLGGFSEIRRCARNIRRDVNLEPISCTRDDRFCLDGMRLVPLPGSQGQDVEYRTERDTFARIVARNVLPSGPSFFTVFQRDGRILQYGGTADARLAGRIRSGPDADVVMAWGLNKVEDRTGNFMTITYELDRHPGDSHEWKPAEIQYGGNSITGRVHDRGVRLRYFTTVPYVFPQVPVPARTWFTAGFRMTHTTLLERIEMFGPGAGTGGRDVLRFYAFTYEMAESRPRLAKIRECDLFGVCKPDTVFTWKESGGFHFESIPTTVDDLTPAGLENYWGIQVGDFNGDGKEDILYRGLRNSQSDHAGIDDPRVNEDWTIRYSEGLGFGPPVRVGDEGTFRVASSQIPNRGFRGKYTSGFTLDINGDGRTDVASIAGRTADYPCAHWRFFRSNHLLLPSDKPFRWMETDANSDGILGLNEVVEASRLHPDCESESLARDNLYSVYVADLDGDGLPEIMRPLRKTGSQRFPVWGIRRGTASGFGAYQELVVDDPADTGVVAGVQTPVDAQGAYTIDLDGDGRTELLYTGVDDEDRTIPEYIALSMDRQGKMSIRKVGLLINARRGGIQNYFGDFNGDGLTDVLQAPPMGGRPSIGLNSGNGLNFDFQAVDSGECLIGNAIVRPDSLARDPGVRIGDLDGDGDADILLAETDFGFAPPGEPERDSPVVANVMLSQNTGNGIRFSCEPMQRITGTGPVVIDLINGKPTGYIGSDTRGLRSAGHRLSQLADVDGDGLKDILMVVGNKLNIYRSVGAPPSLIGKVVNGLGAGISVEYKPLSDTAVHEGSAAGTPGCSYPTRCLNSGRWVVSRHTADNGVDNVGNSFSYKYARAVSDVLGNGWLGFHERTVTESRTGIVRKYRYNPLRFAGALQPFGSMPTREEVSIPLGAARRDLVRDISYQAVPSPEFGGAVVAMRRVFVREDLRETIPSRPGRPQLIGHTESTFQYGDYYNETYRRVESFEPGPAVGEEPIAKLDLNVFERTTTFQEPDRLLWFVSLFDRVVDKSTVPDGRSTTRTVQFIPEPETGLLKTRIVEPEGDATKRLETTFSYTSEGLVREVVVQDSSGDRRTKFGHDARGLFVEAVTNPVGHVTRTIHHPGFGVEAMTFDADGRASTYQYDGLLRPVVVAPSGSGEVTFSYQWIRPAGSFIAFQVTEKHESGPQTRYTADILGRVVGKETRERASGPKQWARTDIEFDALGRTSSMSRPYFEGDAIAKTVTSYDVLGRPLTVTDPTGAGSSWQYIVRTVVATDPAGRTSEGTADLLGRATQSLRVDREGPGAITAFSYGPFGLVESVTTLPEVGGASQVRTFEYDSLGRRLRSHDPDSGLTTTDPNAFGEVIASTDATGRRLRFVYDKLGRLEETTDERTGQVASDRWDFAVNGTGARESATSFDGVTSTFSYDSEGRLSDEAQTSERATLSLSRTYDAFGRVFALVYPAVGGRRPESRYQYDPTNGNLSSVAFDGSTVWTSTERDAEGRVRQEEYGNGVSTQFAFDSRGFVESIASENRSRSLRVQDLTYLYRADGNLDVLNDNAAGTQESFGYDDLDRVTEWRVRNAGRAEYEYDPFGNLLSRTSLDGLALRNVSFAVTGGSSGGPNAVKSSSFGGAYTYDAKGNQLSGGGRRQVKYTSFDLPKSIELDDGRIATLTYDRANQRARKVFDGEETIYLGELYERRARAGAATEHVFYVVGEKPLAEVVWEEPATGPVVVARKLFIHEDRLGSVEKVTNGQGQIEEARKYDPFGAQIDIRDLTRPPSAVSTSTRTGYTGHEGDMGGLVNMRGRIYDPATMRFLTTDPLVSAPGDAQSWNPYSYVVNNPLAYVDPTGFQQRIVYEKVTRYDFEDDYVQGDVSGGGRVEQRYDESDRPGSGSEPAPAPSSRGTFDDSGVSQVLNDPAFNQVSSTPAVRVTVPANNFSTQGQSGGPLLGADGKPIILAFGGPWPSAPDGRPLSFSDMFAGPNGPRAMGLATLGVVAVTAVGAAPGLAMSLGTRAAPLAPLAGTPAGRSLAQAIDAGLVRSGGKLAQVLGGMERAFGSIGPRNAMQGLEVVSRATRDAGLDIGIGSTSIGGSIVLQNVGNVVTTIASSGAITVTRGADLLLQLLPK